MVKDLVVSFKKAKMIPAKHVERDVPISPGYYSIWVDHPDCLPGVFAERLKADNTLRIYVGITTGSLLQRLVKEDLQHSKASTFFRGIGSILGYRPPFGSMADLDSQNNYKFSKGDNRRIFDWIDKHICVQIVEDKNATKEKEEVAIGRFCPILNDIHNPRRMKELRRLRALCREIAAGKKTT